MSYFKELLEDNLVFSHIGYADRTGVEMKIGSNNCIIGTECISSFSYLGLDFYIIGELPNEPLSNLKRLEVTSRILEEL
jgi:hypothetical protein